MTESNNVGTDIVTTENTMGLNNDAYKELRDQIVAACEQLAGGESNDAAKMSSMQYYAHLEEAVRVAALDAAKDGPTAQRAFIKGLQAFLR